MNPMTAGKTDKAEAANKEAAAKKKAKNKAMAEVILKILPGLS